MNRKAPEEPSGNDQEDPGGEGDLHPFSAEGPFGLLHPAGRGTGMGEQPIDPDGVSDVLQGLLSQILVIEADLPLHLTVHRVRDGDPSPFGQSLEAGSDVDTVSVDPTLLLHHIS